MFIGKDGKEADLDGIHGCYEHMHLAPLDTKGVGICNVYGFPAISLSQNFSSNTTVQKSINRWKEQFKRGHDVAREEHALFSVLSSHASALTSPPFPRVTGRCAQPYNRATHRNLEAESEDTVDFDSRLGGSFKTLESCTIDRIRSG